MNSISNQKPPNTKRAPYHLNKSFSSNRQHLFCFDSYLAGLFEADGHIWIPTQKQGSKKHNPRFHITFHMKDYPLAEKILQQIGQGFIRQKPKQNACVFTVSSVKGLKKIIHMINGKMRTPKIYKVGLLIDWLNQSHSFDPAIPFYKQDNSNLADNSWFAGFIDGDGSFGIRYTAATKNSKRRIACRFRLEQRMHDPVTNQSYHDIFTSIASLLSTKVHEKQQSKTGRTYYNIEISSKRSISLLVKYLKTHPLLSSKLLDYKDWAKVFEWICTGSHYTEQACLFVQNVKSSMNHARSYYNWDHLLIL